MNFKELRLANNKRNVKDPVRFPKVILAYEDKSKGDFKKSLQLEGNHLSVELLKSIKD